MRLRQRHTAWLAALAILLGVPLVAGSLVQAPSAAVVLVALFIAALVATLVEVQPRRVSEGASQSPLTRMRMSSQAREATERARRRSSYAPPGLNLLDVGLISLQSSSEGMVMRRSRSISLDDNGVRPYITLHVDPQDADRNAVIRFEILDHNGQAQYIHEMKTYLRDGEMNILADHQLPLAGNERLSGAGEWDLRVSVDGTLLGLLSFTATPSLSDRQRRFAPAAEDSAVYRLQDEAEEDAPVSLEDLMRANAKNRNARR